MWGFGYVFVPDGAPREVRLLPARSLWRTLAVVVAALVLSQAAALWLLNEYVTRPRTALGHRASS